MKEKTLYEITSEDVMMVSEDIDIPVSFKDMSFIEDKIGDFLGDQWRDAIEYALAELEEKRKTNVY